MNESHDKSLLLHHFVCTAKYKGDVLTYKVINDNKRNFLNLMQ